ncbi:hypothetical protein [Nocardia sp. SYP-A9097]|uniref:hypothetical protein n=1 Tax=Nocardia sp. SYP-A9097 TaxID=2663237 RepID=UPI002815CE0E|nr:hypothetical protein [Nocardia sp. SYP-A9097]
MLNEVLERIRTDFEQRLLAQATGPGDSPADLLRTATFLLAQVRGLQLDLITTGDRSRVDDAFEATVEFLVSSLVRPSDQVQDAVS